MNLLKNIPLSQYTTFKTGGLASFFVEIQNTDELKEALHFAKKEKLLVFILGGGSNILVSDNGFDGLVIKISIKGFQNVEDKMEMVVGAGEEWDDVVKESLKLGYIGMENMSGIPGTIGGAVVGNIGAYGREIKEFVSLVEVLDIPSGQIFTISNQDCKFEYRSSIFKKALKEVKVEPPIVLQVTLKFKKNEPIDIEYRDLDAYFYKIGVSDPNAMNIRDAVLNVRSAKMPDWKDIGTAGSFFKNPIISKGEYETLLKKFSELPGNEDSEGKVKIPLAWVIDKICGLKSTKLERVGTYPSQALVIVSNGGTSSLINSFANKIAESVFEKTGIRIEREVETVGIL